MSRPCLEFREELHARIDLLALRPQGSAAGSLLGPGGTEDPLTLHLRDCSACRLRSERLVSALSSFGVRQPAPGELDGRVVGAMGDGYRQERGVKVLLRVLSRRPAAPGGLEESVEERLQGSPNLRPTLVRALRARVPAPGVLERLVAEEIRDPARSTVRRFVGILGRVQAPRDLERGLNPRASWRMRVPLTVAATLLAVLFLVRRETEQSYSFRVLRPSSVAELSPMARSLLEAATAGASSSRLRSEDRGPAK